ncbi:Histone acetyltransferase HPA2/related acetyltransferase [Hahella chejuensis KCTC 2396]|uniref:Histone acetyltransferase HPA2/related acetyltransferase n=1 Tax=Hahella chejuensis (strain KCTC 2396) TaxID=349521 RepID=Q2SPQ0_HAHCH|nr:GNAT family N-acetyltransferase [Hahella chejuensis]ABC27374.1 Histone acetyltransferase HPA2/related acetyltransferase [Hahella chejuensis KCTC 2396]
MREDADVRFIPLKTNQLSEAFAAYKAGLYTSIDTAFGWDEDYQTQRFHRSYAVEDLYWIFRADNRVGLICYRLLEDALHLHLALIFKEAQRQGLGSQVMEQLRRLTQDNNRPVTLSSFKSNPDAVRFYQRHGYRITGEDAHFFELTRDCNQRD